MEICDVITSGYVSMDHIIRINTPAKIGFTSLVSNKTSSKIYYGGCSVNIAYSLCKLGVKTAPILRVGSDYEEIGLKKFLVENNVPTCAIDVIDDEVTSTCYLIQDNNNDHITIFYDGAMNGKYSHELEDELFEKLKLGVMTVASETDNREFLKKCKKFDIPLVFGMKDDFNAFPLEFLKEVLLYSKIIFTNETEREVIEKCLGLNDIKDLFDIGNMDIIITTMGKDGSVYMQKTDTGIKEGQIGIFEVDNVVDATGSGDAYMSGFIYGYLKNMDIESCCRLGGTLASFVLVEEGCLTNIPTEAEFLERFKICEGN